MNSTQNRKDEPQRSAAFMPLHRPKLAALLALLALMTLSSLLSLLSLTPRRKGAKTQRSAAFMPLHRPKLAALLALLALMTLLPLPCFGDWYNATITVTNTAGTTNGQTYTIAGATRTWTNSVAVPATQILTNNTLAGAAGAMKIQAGAYPFANLQMFPTTYGFTVRSNAYFTASISAGWGTLVLSTNVVTNAITVAIPLSTYAPNQQTNVASAVADMLNSSANTNQIAAAKITAFTTNTVATSNATVKPMINATNQIWALQAGTNITLSLTSTSLVVNTPAADLWPTSQAAVVTLVLNNKYQGLATNDNVAYTGFSGWDASETNVYWASVFVTNTSGSTKTITFPASVIGDATIYVTNQSVFSVLRYPTLGTNVVGRALN